MALLTLDNLTGDESLSWLRDAVPAATGDQLTGVGKILPLRVDATREAHNAEASLLVHGYFDRRGAPANGALHFEFAIEDSATRKIQTLAVNGDLLAAAGQLAKAIDSAAQPFSTANPQAATAWGKRDFAQATSLDPDFGAAWQSWIQNLAAAGKPEDALNTATTALARESLRSPIDRANIALAAATLRKDGAATRQAMGALLKLAPNDVGLVERLAQQETAARNFTEAARLNRELLRLRPSDPVVHNALGYALFFAGDLAGARKEFDEYGQALGHEANALDSQGEVLFMAGEFSQAETYFLNAHARNPDMLAGSDLLKAAYAHWLGGDLNGADKTFDTYLKYLSEHADQSVLFRQAVWEYATGREAQARTRLASATGPLADVARNQLLVWDNAARLPSDVTTLDQTYRNTAAANDGLVRTLYARALLGAGRRDEARKLVQTWPLPESGELLLQASIYPIFKDVRQKLALKP
ncbi:MAG: hypothetical protein ABI811_04240 [Acidobacteriota bacterium]